jgi:hypothetical protein
MSDEQPTRWSPGDEVFHEDFGLILPATVRAVDRQNGWVTVRPHDRPENWLFGVPPYSVWSPEEVRMCAGCGCYLVEAGINVNGVYWEEGVARCESCGPIVWVPSPGELERSAGHSVYAPDYAWREV